MTAWTRRAPAAPGIALLAAALVAACGASGSAAPSSADAGATPASSRGASGVGAAVGGTSSTGVSATMTVTPDTAGGLLQVSVVVTGPARLYGGCQPTLSVRLLDPSGQAAPATAAPPSARCLAITDIAVASGQTRTFTASVPLPAGHGTYTVRASIEGGGDLPAVTVSL